MAKRKPCKEVGVFRTKMHKHNRQLAQQTWKEAEPTLRKLCCEQPIVLELLLAMSKKFSSSQLAVNTLDASCELAVSAHRPAIESQPTAPAPSMIASSPLATLPAVCRQRANICGMPAWTQDFGTISRFPQYAKRDLLVSTEPLMTEKTIKLLKTTDKRIVERMFEFAFGLPGRFKWPQGPCHVRGVIEQVLKGWKTHTCSQHQLATIMSDLEANGYNICWANVGVYGLLPEDCEKKLYVLHKPSGIAAPIPERIQGKGPLTLAKNWSVHDAELVTADGHYYPHKVTHFLLTPEQSEAQWIAFAKRTGQGKVDSAAVEQGSQG